MTVAVSFASVIGAVIGVGFFCGFQLILAVKHQRDEAREYIAAQESERQA